MVASSNAPSVNSLEAPPDPEVHESSDEASPETSTSPTNITSQSPTIVVDQSRTFATKDEPSTLPIFAPLTEKRRKRRSMINVFHDGANVDGYGMTNNAVYGMQTVAGYVSQATKLAFPTPYESLPEPHLDGETSNT